MSCKERATAVGKVTKAACRFEPGAVNMTEHRCIDGSWQPGKTRDCEACSEKRKPLPVKRLAES